MSMVLLDGWTLATAANQIIGQKYENEKLEMCLGNLLMGIVLWEDIRFPLDAQYRPYFETFQNKIGKNNPLLDICKPLDSIEFPQLEKFPSIDSNEGNILDYDEINFDEFLKRIEKYEVLRDSLNINYFPHPGRAQYMLEQQEKFDKVFERNAIINNEIDKPLREYYYEIEQRYNRRILNCLYPVLYNYIKNEAKKIGDSPKYEVVFALELRKNPDVIAFREILKQMEEDFKKMNLTAVDRVIDEIREISRSIIGISPKEIKEEPLPIILTETGAEEKPLNLTFVTKLLHYGKENVYP